jgi:hypothetical protein
MREPDLNPPCDEFEDYEMPILCESKIRAICADIVNKGDRTKYQDIYDAIYEVIEPHVRDEYLNRGAD